MAWDVIGPGINKWEQRIETGEANSPASRRTTRADSGGAGLDGALAVPRRMQGSRVRIQRQLAAGDRIGCSTPTRCRWSRCWTSTLETFTRQHRGWFAAAYETIPSPAASAPTCDTFFTGIRDLALIARMNDGPWWTLDEWIPRCDPRIPLRDREPRRSDNCRPGQAQIPWMREAIKWHLGTALEAGTLTWSSVPHRCCRTADYSTGGCPRWMTRLRCSEISTDASEAAASFRRWVSDPANRTRSAIKAISIAGNGEQEPSSRRGADGLHRGQPRRKPATHRPVTVGRPHRRASADLAKADHPHTIRATAKRRALRRRPCAVADRGQPAGTRCRPHRNRYGPRR